ncbi:tetratricopeptide repeat protein [Acaryochloris sp. IP29b_bin.137]|uniref:tetratricopeptide repeat protein n=1 Tax=Acaryochloris sp. IP29b_bin.137 TaxID=2969217 RepID=UPI00262E21D1|nr:tetratricopeptide repeat protein [Acaryochloris sp. IP29b_bin.137]
MSLFFGDDPKALNLLSIGDRGVGKTVFLVGSYTESNSSYEGDQQKKVWFDCQDQEAHENIQGVMNYIAQTGQYPPPTMKISGFNFSLKQQRPWGTQTLCYFRWWDMPGEICDMKNRNFQSMILSSQGCCVFINAYDLINDPAYLDSVKDIIELVTAIASLIKHHNLQYPMALIFTQCDRLEEGPLGQLQIEKCLEPLIIRLENARTNYRRFYSSIPIVRIDGMPVLRASGSSDALVWITSELCKARSVQSGQDLASSLSQSTSLKKFVPTAARRPALTLGLISAGVVGVLAMGFALTSLWSNQQPQQAKATQQTIADHQDVLTRDPNNLNSLISVYDHYLEIGQPAKAVPLLEKIVAQKSNDVGLKFNLADLYELTGDKQKAENTYDKILTQHPQEIKAMVGKAILRGEEGDMQTAQSLFLQAENIAETKEAKGKIKEIAAQTLQAPSNTATQ